MRNKEVMMLDSKRRQEVGRRVYKGISSPARNKNHQHNQSSLLIYKTTKATNHHYHFKPILNQIKSAIMHFSTFTAASILALASSTFASKVAVKNNCPQDIFLQITRQDQSHTQQKIASNGGYFSEQLNGQGNSYGITKNQDYYSPNTPKLIWGASDSAGVVYYSLNNVDGNPFNGQSVKLTGNQQSCPAVTSVDGSTKACSNVNDFTLTLC